MQSRANAAAAGGDQTDQSPATRMRKVPDMREYSRHVCAILEHDLELRLRVVRIPSGPMWNTNDIPFMSDSTMNALVPGVVSRITTASDAAEIAVQEAVRNGLRRALSPLDLSEI